MKLYNQTVNEFVELVDSSSPTPGGGSSSALMSVLGLSLSRMVGHLTVNKRKFSRLEEDIQVEFNNNLNALLTLKDKLIPLIDEDSASFNLIMAAYRLPKETAEDIEIRKTKIKEATIEAIRIPFEVAKLSYEAFKYLPFILKYGNMSAVSDLGVSVLALSSGVEGAIYNVFINLIGFDDEDISNYYKTESDKLLKQTNTFKTNFIDQIYKALEYK